MLLLKLKNRINEQVKIMAHINFSNATASRIEEK